MKVYATYRNADMTEGRGPMVLDTIFLHEQDANNYIDKQCGVMGRTCKWSKMEYGDWQVKELDVLEGPFDSVKEKIKIALAKLTTDEKRLLNLDIGLD